MNTHAVVIIQTGTQHGIPYRVGAGVNVHMRLKVNTPKHDSRVRRRWPESHSDLVSFMQPNASFLDSMFNCTLSNHRIRITYTKTAGNYSEPTITCQKSVMNITVLPVIFAVSTVKAV